MVPTLAYLTCYREFTFQEPINTENFSGSPGPVFFFQLHYSLIVAPFTCLMSTHYGILFLSFLLSLFVVLLP